MRYFYPLGRILAALLHLALVMAAGTQAEDVTVMSNTESLTVFNTNNDGTGSLRQAIRDANSNAASGRIIDFAPSAYGRILLTSGELLITNDVIIQGPGPDKVAVDGNAAGRVFHVGSNATVTIANLTITNGHLAPDPLRIYLSGSGIYNEDGRLTVSNCVVSGNSATSLLGGGAGIFNHGHANYSSTEGFKGAILRVLECTVTGNSAVYGGGGILNYAELGGSANVQVINSQISRNVAEYGGGLLNAGFNSGEGIGSGVEIVNSTINRNVARQWGGGILNYEKLYLTNNTIAENIAIRGGGIVNDGQVRYATAQIANCTISSNSASVEGTGGAILNLGTLGSANLVIVSSTLKGNSAANVNWAGGSIFSHQAALEIGNCVLDDKTAGANVVASFGPVISLGYNLSSDDGGGVLTNATDQINTEPLLGPLQNNGGRTLTHAPLCGSPAIDKGKDLSNLPTDQRGLHRPYDNPRVSNATGGDGSDIGAFEHQLFCNYPPVAGARLTVGLVISANNSNANVILDGSRSYDIDGDPLQYFWYETGSSVLLATGAVASVVLTVGTHTIVLVVNDGLSLGRDGVTVEVITAAEAVKRLAETVGSEVPRSQGLVASLNAASASSDRSNAVSAINELLAFQNKVRVQVAPLNGPLADRLIQGAQQVIEVLSSVRD